MVVSGKDKDYKAGKGHAQGGGILGCVGGREGFSKKVFDSQQHREPPI